MLAAVLSANVDRRNPLPVASRVLKLSQNLSVYIAEAVQQCIGLGAAMVRLVGVHWLGQFLRWVARFWFSGPVNTGVRLT